VTIAFSVPRNDRLARVAPEGPDAAVVGVPVRVDGLEPRAHRRFRERRGDPHRGARGL